MESGIKKFKVLGHPAHVPFTHFPLALWTAAFCGDLAYAWTADPFWWSFAFWDIALGLVLGGMTLLTGFYDFFLIPEGKPLTVETALRHMMAMLTAACLFGISLYFHRGPAPPTQGPLFLALGFSGAGTLFLHCGGWLGGHLVYHHGIGYDD